MLLQPFIDCHPSCSTCNGGSDTNCLSCSVNYLNLPPVGSCTASCPSGYYQNGGTMQCTQCFQGSGPTYYTCATCSGGSSTNCNSCNVGSFLDSNKCVNPCPNGYWGDTSSNTCKSCYSGTGPFYTCATCSGGASNNCNSCNAGSFLYSNECINPCPNGYWGDTSTHTCQSCYSSGTGPFHSCATCSAGGSNNCNSCNSGKFLHLNTCIDPCPDGYWGDSSTNTCEPCYSSGTGPYYTCATCSAETSTSCNSCNSGAFLYPNTGGDCRNPCPDGYWGDTSTNKCQQCYSSETGPSFTCLACSAGGSNNCNSCNSGYFLYPNTGGACIEICPDSYWGDTLTNTCQPCYSSEIGPYYTCATCSAGASNNCNSCSSGSFFYLNTCINPCPNGYWEDSTINTCKPCYSSETGQSFSCATCSAGASNNCNSCNSGYFLHPNTEGECITTCPDGYWGDTSTNKCQPCYSSETGPNYSCFTCSGGEAENCTSCSSSTFLYPIPIGICTTTCPDGYWADPSSNICQPCYNNTLNTSICACKTCNGPESNHCLSCFNGSFLQPDNEGHCLDTCPSSYWRDASLNKCITCNVTCQSTLVYSFLSSY